VKLLDGNAEHPAFQGSALLRPARKSGATFAQTPKRRRLVDAYVFHGFSAPRFRARDVRGCAGDSQRLSRPAASVCDAQDAWMLEGGIERLKHSCRDIAALHARSQLLHS
jgi:hypothetical protein